VRIGFLSIVFFVIILVSSIGYANELPGMEAPDQAHMHFFLFALNTASFGVNTISFIGSFESSDGCKLLSSIGLTIGVTSLLYLSQLEDVNGFVFATCSFNSLLSLVNLVHGFNDNHLEAIESHRDILGLWINRENDLGFRISLDF
jgi:hypothetical protein